MNTKIQEKQPVKGRSMFNTNNKSTQNRQKGSKRPADRL